MCLAIVESQGKLPWTEVSDSWAFTITKYKRMWGRCSSNHKDRQPCRAGHFGKCSDLGQGIRPGYTDLRGIKYEYPGLPSFPPIFSEFPIGRESCWCGKHKWASLRLRVGLRRVQHGSEGPNERFLAHRRGEVIF